MEEEEDGEEVEEAEKTEMQMHFKQMFGHKQRNSKPIRVEFGCRKTRN